MIRLSRLRDNPSTAVGSGGCTVAGTGAVQHGTDIWPNVLFDTREGTLRDVALAGNAVTLAGTMHYVELDVANLDKWFTGLLGASGTNANNTTGYTVYFSDRRGDRHDPSPPPSVGTTPTKTGAFGFDDFVNSSDVNGCPNGALEGAEDFESDFTMGTDLNPPATPRKYGEFFPTDGVTTTNDPNLWNLPGNVGMQINGVFSAASPAILNNPTCAAPGKDWPFAVAANAQDLRENPPVHFRRALKLVDGATLSIGTCDAVACGLTIVAENPIYVQGDYNAGINGNFATAFVAAAVIGDAVTLLSDNWNDVNSFAFPYTPNSRAGNTTTYRMAVVGGKTIPFKQPTVNMRWRGLLRRLRHGRWRAQLPALHRDLERHAVLQGIACEPVLQPPGSGYIQVLHYGVQPANSRIQLPDGVPDSEPAAAANADVPGDQHDRILTGRAADAVETVFPATPLAAPVPPGSRFYFGERCALTNQGEAGRVRGLKFVFAAGVAQEGADGGPQRLVSGSLILAGVTNPSSGSA